MFKNSKIQKVSNKYYDIISSLIKILNTNNNYYSYLVLLDNQLNETHRFLKNRNLFENPGVFL